MKKILGLFLFVLGTIGFTKAQIQPQIAKMCYTDDLNYLVTYTIIKGRADQQCPNESGKGFFSTFRRTEQGIYVGVAQLPGSHKSCGNIFLRATDESEFLVIEGVDSSIQLKGGKVRLNCQNFSIRH